MKTRLSILLLLLSTGLLVFIFSGCYTQLGMTKNEQTVRNDEYTNDTLSNDSNYYGENEYNHRYSEPYNDYYYGGYPNNHMGFSYYYPSTFWPSYAFNVAYSDPWMYGSYSYYDPWWCGTPYVNYPSYGYYPSNGYYPYGYYGHGYGYTVVPARHVRRTFGSTRGGRASTDVNTNYSSPNSTRSGDVSSGGILTGAPSGGSTSSNPTSINNNGNSGAMQRGGTSNTATRTNVNPTRTNRGSNARVVRRRVGAGRDTRYQAKPNESTPTTPPSQQNRTNTKENHGFGGPRGGATRTSPSFVPGTRQSGGNAQPSNDGNRGGSSHGERRP